MSLVNFTQQDGVAVVTLNRPDKLNAINAAMLDELERALDRAVADDSVSVIVLAGEGRAFSAGFDLDMGKPPPGMDEASFIAAELRRDFDVIMKFWDCPKPTIAAVHGYCLGSSMELTAVCDITIAAQGCRFGAPEVRFGSGIVCLILPWIIGSKFARELLLLGSNDVDAQRACSMGLVNRVVEADQLLPGAMQLANDIAANNALAVRLTKRAINRSLEIAGIRDALDEALALDVTIETSGLGSE